MSEDVIKNVLRLIPYGFYAFTSRNGDDVNAMVGNWFSQVSFTPRLVMFALAKSAHSHTLIKAGEAYVVNIFHADDKDAIMPFTKGRGKNPDKMTNAKFTSAPETGLPILDGAAAYLEVKVIQFVDVGGDHDLAVGEVIGAGVNKDMESTDVLTLPKLGWSYAG